jgi:hypothetical protein
MTVPEDGVKAEEFAIVAYILSITASNGRENEMEASAGGVI